MKFWDRISHLTQEAFPRLHFLFTGEQRATVNMPKAVIDWINNAFNDGEKTTAGITVDSDTALTHSAVYRAVNILSSTIASLPIELFKPDEKGDITKVNSHPGLRLLTRSPNEIQTPYIFIETMQTGPLTWGNGYAYIHRDIIGQPKRLQLIHPKNVQVKATDQYIFYDIQDFEGGDKNNVRSMNILHVPGLGYDGVVGKSPINVAAESIAGGLATQKFGNKFYANGANQTGILMHPHQLSAKAQENLKSSFDKKTKGLDNAGGTMILEEGLKYQPITIPPEQAQFLQSRRFSVEEVARWFGLPPHLLADLTKSSYNSIEAQGLEFLIYTLRAWLKRWEQELDRKLLTESELDEGYFFKFNIEGLLRADSTTRANFLTMMVNNGLYTINEARKIEKMPRYNHENADKLMKQVQNVPIDNLNNLNNET